MFPAFINGVLTVNPAPLSAVAAAASRIYGDPNPAFTGSVTGLKNGDVITATFASAASATSPVGTYPIVATLSDPGLKLANYTVNSNNGTLTVTQASLTVTAGNASRLYGDPNPSFTGAITGLKNGDNITATISGADPTTAVGTYPLVPSLGPRRELGELCRHIQQRDIHHQSRCPFRHRGQCRACVRQSEPCFHRRDCRPEERRQHHGHIYQHCRINSILGTYPIVPTVNDPSLKLGNYTVTSKNGVLIIGPATPIVLYVQAGQFTALLDTHQYHAGPIFPTGTVQFSEGTTARASRLRFLRFLPELHPLRHYKSR